MSVDSAGRVSTIELFFDLVFVFTITQLTHLVAHAHGVLDLARALVVLTLVWWMYAGYAWLTNGVGAGRRMRAVLVAGMIGFLVIALAIPEVFGASGVAFGLAYLFVVLLHLAAFYRSGGTGMGRATLRLARFNVTAAALVLAAGFVRGAWSWLLLAAAAAVYVFATLRHAERGFPINAPHFVERHGLVIIIALGETIVSVGVAGAERGVDVATAILIGLAVVFLAAIWWSYFDRDDASAEHTLMATAAEDRAVLGVRAFWFPFLTMIFGIVLVAAGLKHVIVSLGAAPHATEGTLEPIMLGVGTALYLAGSAWFRHMMRIRPVQPRLGGAAAALVLGAFGFHLPGFTALALLAALLVTLLTMEHQRYHSTAHLVIAPERESP